MSNREFNLDSIDRISKYRFVADLITDCLSFKYKPKQDKLTSDSEKLWNEIYKMHEQQIAGSGYDKILGVLKKIMRFIIVVWIIVGFSGSILSYFMLTVKSFISTFSLASGIGFGGYKLIEMFLEKKANEESEKLAEAMSLKKGEYDACESELKKVNEIIKKLSMDEYFLKYNSPESFRNKKILREYEPIILEYLERGISLLSLLFLLDNGSLPNKSPSQMSDNELNNMLMRLHDVDKKLSKDPELFFENEPEESQASSIIMPCKESETVFVGNNSFEDDEAQWTMRFQPVRRRYVPSREPEQMSSSDERSGYVPPSEPEQMSSSGGRRRYVPPRELEQMSSSDERSGYVPPSEPEQMSSSGGRRR